MKDIIVLAPIIDVYEKAEEIIKEQGYSNVEVVLGTMSEGLKLAKEMEKNGAKIIVTRGGTYKLVKSELKIPVAEIKVSAYDIIESFDKVENTNEVIGLVGYSNVVFGFNILQKLIPNEVKMIVLESESEIADIVSQYKNKGINTFIGDSNVAKIVDGLDCKGIMITSQKESIQVAIQEARRILRATENEIHRAKHLKAVTDFVQDGIISIDKDNKITLFNHRAEKLLKTPSKEALGMDLHDFFRDQKFSDILAKQEQKSGEIISEKNLKLSVNYIPLMIGQDNRGSVVTFQEIGEIQKMEYNIRKSLAKKGFVAKYTFDDIVHESPQMNACILTAKKFSIYDAPIHIYGESGTGKELFAQSIHNASKREDAPFVAVNCAAIPPNLIESEFFGYEEGAFTGAKKTGKPGVFELAHNGTLFLDEISEIPLELQGRLLRVLQEMEVMRVGGNKLIPINVKIITASNKVLSELVKQKEFRKDLYYRINVLTMKIPRLDERKEDIVVLARYFIEKFSIAYGKIPMNISEKVEALLKEKTYDGNIRELENLMERSVILSSFDHLFEQEKTLLKDENNSYEGDSFMEFVEGKSLKEIELDYIKKVYEETGENIQETCEILEISRSTLWRKLQSMS